MRRAAETQGPAPMSAWRRCFWEKSARLSPTRPQAALHLAAILIWARQMTKETEPGPTGRALRGFGRKQGVNMPYARY
ncbi:hypothetical protein GPN2_20329 [Streptomyces murinus]